MSKNFNNSRDWNARASPGTYLASALGATERKCAVQAARNHGRRYENGIFLTEKSAL